MATDDTTPQFDKPTFTDFEASEEEDVRFALGMNVFHVLSTTIGDRQPPREKFHRSSALNYIKGNPDFVLLAGGNLLLPIEVKTA